MASGAERSGTGARTARCTRNGRICAASTTTRDSSATTWRFFSDLSALKRSREELDQLAHFDPLVNLPNRLLFTERAKQDLERARANKRSGALLLIDLDHFKDINESLGHNLGDTLLQAVSARLSEQLESGMTLGRLGGDEFALLCEDYGAEKATALALRILDRLNEPFRLGERELFSSASIGIVLYPYPTDVQNVEQLMRNADSALFKAKSSGRSAYAFYSQELTSQARQRVELVTALRQALSRGNCACTTSRSTTCARAASAASRRWCAGSTRRRA